MYRGWRVFGALVCLGLRKAFESLERKLLGSKIPTCLLYAVAGIQPKAVLSLAHFGRLDEF
jgi:hypothetical protein